MHQTPRVIPKNNFLLCEIDDISIEEWQIRKWRLRSLLAWKNGIMGLVPWLVSNRAFPSTYIQVTNRVTI